MKWHFKIPASTWGILLLMSFVFALTVESVQGQCFTSGVVVLSKVLYLEQTTDQPPHPLGTQPYSFFAVVLAFASEDEDVTVTTPTGAVFHLTGQPTSETGVSLFQFAEAPAYSDQSALDAAWPAGSYTVNVPDILLPATAVVPFTAGSFPSHPTVRNFKAMQRIFPTKDLNLGFEPFQQAGASDYTVFAASDSSGNVILTNKLPATVTNVVIQGGTFGGDRAYPSVLDFNKVTAEGAYLLSDGIFCFQYESSYISETEVSLRTTNATYLDGVSGPVNQQFGFQFCTVPGRTYTIEDSTDFHAWRSLETTNATANMVHFVTPATGGNSQFFRVKEN